MIFIERLDHVVLSIRGSPFLQFLGLTPPYRIRKHPLSFSSKDFTSLLYFPSSSVLVCAGEGIQLTKIVIPAQFVHTNPVLETLQFEHIATLYSDLKFKFSKPPAISALHEVLFVHFESAINVHSSNGRLIQQIEDPSFGSLSWLSFNDGADTLLATCGSEMVLFERDFTFKGKVLLEDLKYSFKYNFGIENLIFGHIFTKEFGVLVSGDEKIALVSLRTKTAIQVQILRFSPWAIRAGENGLYFLKDVGLQKYFCHIFTSESKLKPNDYLILKRCPSLPSAPRFLCVSADSALTICTAQSGKVITTVAGHGPISIAHVLYTRDTVHDGEHIIATGKTDGCYILLSNGAIVELSLDSISRFGGRNGVSALLDTNDGCQVEKFPSRVFAAPAQIRFVVFVRVQSPHNPAELCGISENGVICLIQTESSAPVKISNLPDSNVLTALFSNTFRLLIVSCVGHLFTYDLSAQQAQAAAVNVAYTTIEFVSDRICACGGSNGVFDLREFPSLLLLASSSPFAAAEKPDLSLDPAAFFTMPRAITFLDYCITREIVLCATRHGAITLYTLKAIPIVHIELGFSLSAVCFMNGKGTLLLSFLGSLYKVKSSELFSKALIAKPTPFDDFGIRGDPLDDVAFVFQSQKRSKRLFVDQRQTLDQRPKALRSDFGWEKEENEADSASMFQIRSLVKSWSIHISKCNKYMRLAFKMVFVL
jgi:hypothetical protein